MHTDAYTAGYYESLGDSARSSAEVIVPLVLQLVRPRHVLDVGCGIGMWLSVFQEHGVHDVWGIDGPEVDTAMLRIPKERFQARDLTQPFHMDRHFDLVVSLEVAEHLPASCAESFVQCLTELGPVVLFSAAIPGQGGRHHVNEQWPEYWAELFEHREYVVLDCLRRKIWRNRDVAYWYAQNLLLFVACEHLRRDRLLQNQYDPVDTPPLALVHPRKFRELIEWCQAHCGDT